MALTSNRNEPFEHGLYLGIIFVMLDGGRRVICRVSKAALEDRGMKGGRRMTAIEAFQRYRSEIEAAASRQYKRGLKSPVVESEDLVSIRIRSRRPRRRLSHTPARLAPAPGKVTFAFQSLARLARGLKITKPRH